MIKCFYADAGLNFKNGTVTCCPRQSDHLAEMDIPSKVFNSEGFRWLRNELDEDRWPRGCDLCRRSEVLGHQSMRQDYSPTPGHLGGGRSPFENLRHVELRFSNSCNMACLHCSEVYSSGWTKKLEGYEPTNEVRYSHLHQLTKEMHRKSPTDTYQMKISIPEMSLIVTDLNENFPNLNMVDFAGGEVTVQKQFIPCLELLSKHPNAENIHISFHTNFNTDFDAKKLWEYLTPFKETTVTVSLDAGKRIYPYFRDGNWDKMRKNIDDFKSMGGHTYLQPTCTTSIYQMLDFYNIWESFLELDVDGYSASIVQSPAYLDPSLVMFDFENEIREEIDRTKELVAHNPEAKKWVNYIDDYVSSENLSSVTAYRNYNSFLLYVKETDKLWNQNFNDFYTDWKMEEGELICLK